MKEKIITLIIGMLIGAVITASGFLIYQNANKNTNQTTDGGQMQMMERPDGNNAPPEMSNGETPSEKPSGSENDSNRKEPSEKPSESENNNNKTESSSKSNSKKEKTNSTN